MDVSTLSIKDLVDKVNNDLGKDFCDKFRYKRKELSNSGRASSSSILFKFVDENRDWVINEGGGTEIQFHLYFRDDEIGFGLGFNAQYVPFANLKSPVDYIRPFVNAFLSLKGKGNEKILDLEKIGFSLIEGDWNGLRNITDNEYYLYGKKIQINGGSLSDDDYSQMLECIKKELFNLYVEIWKEKNDMENREEALKEYVSILTNNHNLILTGAPGTGKTYLAKQIAKAMGCTENEIGFVQFHPSYDYTDFVEGLRPTKEGKDACFEKSDGVFKEFCKRALKNIEDSKKDTQQLQKEQSLKDKYGQLIGEIESGNITSIPMRTIGKRMDIVELSNQGNIILKTPETLSTKTYTISLNRLTKLAAVYQTLDSLDKIKNINDAVRSVIKGCHTSAYWSVLKFIYEQVGAPNTEVNGTVKKKNFVFIIDEINRGEISKIFGELFFSMDPGYRGVNGKVQTQYANMETESNEFDDALNETENFGHFFVPENVYIIGTMNDIDRSVESMDFAFRRRFAFKEVTAEESKAMLKNSEAWNGKMPDQEKINEIITRMDKLNNIIWHKKKENEEDEKKSIEGLSSAYHIGASYFLKLAHYEENGNYNFDKLWEYHLEGLLYEYLRGTTDEYRKLKKLAKAYGYSNSDRYE